MSTSLAISAVTEILREQAVSTLRADLSLDSPDLVTVGPPQLMRQGRTDAQFNIFLYQVATDASWRNQDIPGQIKPGERATPLLALRLGYLVTAFGEDDDDFLAHQMLGSVMLSYHNAPVLNRTGTGNVIVQSLLAKQSEAVRITLQPMSLDEMSKLWSGFQSPYRLSVAYAASPVLIDSGLPMKSAPPVLGRGGERDPGFDATATVAQPQLEKFQFDPPYQSHTAGNLLTLIGSGLDDPEIRLLVNNPNWDRPRIARPTAAVTRTPTSLKGKFPQSWEFFHQSSIDPAAETAAVTNDAVNWPAGIYTVACAQRIAIGGSFRLYSTTVLPLSIAPKIVIDGDFEVEILGPVGNPTQAQLTVLITPPLTIDNQKPVQQVRVFVGDLEIVGQITATPVDDATTEILCDSTAPAATISQLRERDQGSLYLRVQVDGVDSSLLEPGPTGARRYDPNLLVTVP